MGVAYSEMKFYPDAMVIEWAIDGVGFGQFEFAYEKDGALHIDTEAMDKETVMAVLENLIDHAKKRGSDESIK